MHRESILKYSNKMRFFTVFYFQQTALHVSGDTFTHHVKHVELFAGNKNNKIKVFHLPTDAQENCFKNNTKI
jgi:hypothetical protein